MIFDKSFLHLSSKSGLNIGFINTYITEKLKNLTYSDQRAL